jgi:hypothetical protein
VVAGLGTKEEESEGVSGREEALFIDTTDGGVEESRGQTPYLSSGWVLLPPSVN